MCPLLHLGLPVHRNIQFPRASRLLHARSLMCVHGGGNIQFPRVITKGSSR
jgi:hypothetical protein